MGFCGQKKTHNRIFLLWFTSKLKPYAKKLLLKIKWKDMKKAIFFQEKKKNKTRHVILEKSILDIVHLTLSWRRPLSYRNQSIDFLCKSMDWFLYDNVLRHERGKAQF